MPKLARTLHRPRSARALAALGAAILLLAGCFTTPKENPPAFAEDEYLAGPAGEPIELLYTFPGTDTPQRVEAELYDGWVIIEGDIALGRYDDLVASASAISQAGGVTTLSHSVPLTQLWPASSAAPPYEYVVPYAVSEDFSDDYVTNVIQPAIDHWNANTNVLFVERTDQADYVSIITGDRCWSEAGFKSGAQELKLGEDLCTQIGTVVHELGHAVGLKHEHQRPDRDQYVEIHLDNVVDGREGNFNLYQQGVPVGPYDYRSVMHYGQRAFGVTNAQGQRAVTITSLGDPISPSTRLSPLDREAVRRLYPEDDLPILAISSPVYGERVNEGVEVTFVEDVVLAADLDESDLVLRWRYLRNGVPYYFAQGQPGDDFKTLFCDGIYDVTLEVALVKANQMVGTATTRLIVDDLGATNPPAECPVVVTIDEPIDGAIYPEGANVALRASIGDDHPETDEPLYPVIWRVGDPETGTIVSTGLEGTTKLGQGVHTIHVSYGAASDSVTVTVVEAGTPPQAAIASPADGTEYRWDVDGSGNGFSIAFSGSGSDAQDGALTGGDLVWETREKGSGTWQERATGTNPTISFPFISGWTTFEVRLTATDSDGMKGSTTIEIHLQGPPS